MQQIRFEWDDEIEQIQRAQPVEVELGQETIAVLIALMARALISGAAHRSRRRGGKDGTRAVVFAALVPRPRTHSSTYHGVLAPAAEWRDWIVPSPPRSSSRDPSQTLAERALRPAKSRATWAELLNRVFEIDVLTCPWCGEKRKLIALITDGAVVRRILEHLGPPTTAPILAPALSPPELEFAGSLRHRDTGPVTVT